jgi:hypothetical protein
MRPTTFLADDALADFGGLLAGRATNPQRRFPSSTSPKAKAGRIGGDELAHEGSVNGQPG